MLSVACSTRQTILRSISYLRPFWQCFAYQQDIDTQSDQLSELFSSLTIANELVNTFVCCIVNDKERAALQYYSTRQWTMMKLLLFD